MALLLQYDLGEFRGSAARAGPVILFALALCIVAGCPGVDDTSSAPQPSQAGDVEPEAPNVDKANADGEAPFEGPEISFDELSLDMEDNAVFQESMLTDEIENLVGSRVRIRGFIDSGSVTQLRNLKKFVLIDEFHMGFVPVYWADKVMHVSMRDDASLNFTTRRIEVEGRLTIDPISLDDRTALIYRLVDARAREVPRSDEQRNM